MGETWKEAKATLALLKPYFARYKGRLLLGFLLLLSLSLLALPGPILNQRAIDDGILKQDFFLLAYFAVLILLLQIGTRIVDFIANRVFIFTSQGAIYDFRRDLFSRILRLPPPYFLEKDAGYLLARINEVNQIAPLFSSAGAQILVSLFEFLGIQTILLYMNWYLTLICLIPVPVIFILVRKWSKGVIQKSKEAMEADDMIKNPL